MRNATVDKELLYHLESPGAAGQSTELLCSPPGCAWQAAGGGQAADARAAGSHVHGKLQEEDRQQTQELQDRKARVEEAMQHQPTGSGVSKNDSWVKTGWLNRCLAVAGVIHKTDLKRCQELIQKLLGSFRTYIYIYIFFFNKQQLW